MAEPSIYSSARLAAISDNLERHEDVRHSGVHRFYGWYVLGIRQMDFVLAAGVDIDLDGSCALISGLGNTCRELPLDSRMYQQRWCGQKLLGLVSHNNHHCSLGPTCNSDLVECPRARPLFDLSA